MATVRFFFDYGSPTAYLAWTRLRDLSRRASTSIEKVPILLGGVFKATGNLSPAVVPAKAKWMFDDVELWAQQDGIDYAMNPHFPINALQLMRSATFARERGELDAHADAVFPAIWRDGRDLGDPAEVAAVLADAGLDAGAYAAGIGDDRVKLRLVAETEAAVAAGLFGVPTFLVGQRLFFGQDRMHFVEAELARVG